MCLHYMFIMCTPFNGHFSTTDVRLPVYTTKKAAENETITTHSVPLPMSDMQQTYDTGKETPWNIFMVKICRYVYILRKFFE